MAYQQSENGGVIGETSGGGGRCQSAGSGNERRQAAGGSGGEWHMAQRGEKNGGSGGSETAQPRTRLHSPCNASLCNKTNITITSVWRRYQRAASAAKSGAGSGVSMLADNRRRKWHLSGEMAA